MDRRLDGGTAHNPWNRERVVTRSRADAAVAQLASAALSAAFIVSSAGAWGSLSARTGPEDPPNQRTAYLWDKPGWRAAERDEWSSHEKNKSWTNIDRSQLPAGRRLVKFT